MDHLSTDQVSKLIAGDATLEEARHAAECADCARQATRLQETFSIFRDSVRQWTHDNGGSAAVLSTPLSDNIGYRARPLRMAVAFALILLIGFPLYQNISERHRRIDSEDSLLLERVNAHLSREVPAPMEPWMEFLSGRSAAEVGGHQ
jgi:hypothetical protein